MEKFTLGLDIGSNSVGWAIINEKPVDHSENLITGVRVFPEGTKKIKGNKEESRNLARRQARLARRQLARRSRRKRKLIYILREAGIIPGDLPLFQEWLNLDPYRLRAKGLDEPLAPGEFARALVHLNQRRGFKSNLKAQADEAKEQNEIKGEISDLQKQIEEAGDRTLGEYFYHQKEKGNRVRDIHTSRAMHEDEFRMLWEKQSEFHPDIWTPELKEQIEKAIFYQRPLKSQAHLIGKCVLEPEERRCPKGSWFAQQFRVLKEINDIRVLSRGNGEELLSPDKRKKLIEELMRNKTRKISVIKDKILGLSDIESLNLESSQKKEMEGNPVEADLRKIFKKEFNPKAQWLRETVWESLLVEANPKEFRKKALGEFQLTESQIEALYKIKRPSGYIHYSAKAIKKLLPYLEERCSEYDAIQNAGYQEQKKIVLGYLPPIHADDFRNPVVIRALSETRKVVNAIVREYGLPSNIVVEMARETKGTINSRQEDTRKNRQREENHERIKKELEKVNVPANHETIEKYKLWEECDRVCPYTGRSIGIHQLYGATCEFDIEHIFPYSRSFDDSFFNKSLCARSENQKKGNNTPYKAYQGTKQLEDIRVRIRKMPHEKQKRFTMKEIPDDFTNRQLQDSSYIAKAVVQYLKQLGVQVRTTRGQITAELRRQWGLNKILGTDGKVKVRDDHRHHAVDAVAIALTTPSHLQTLRRKYNFNRGECFPSPWESAGLDREVFRQAVKSSIEKINVSYRPQHKVAGQLNMKMNYGKTTEENKYVFRVDLRSITLSMVDDIVDKNVRKLAHNRLLEHGVEPGKGSNQLSPSVFNEPLRMNTRKGNPGPLVKRVRITKPFTNIIPLKDQDGKVYRFVEPGSNHHITIFEYADSQGKTRHCKEITSRFEAAQRMLRKEPVIRQVHSEHPEAKFLMSLSINDMVLIPDQGENRKLYRVQKIAGGEGEESIDICFRLHTASTIDYKEELIRIRSLSKEKFKVKKVTVDVLGRIHPCND